MLNNNVSRMLLYSLLFIVLLPAAGGASELGFKGSLLDRPCQIAAASLIQDVIFKTRPAKDFWHFPGRSPTESFSVKLINCHLTTLGKFVRLTFHGEPEPALSGYLKVGGINSGRLGIGIVDTDGKTFLPLGEVHNKGNGNEVTKDSITLIYNAYIQATPEAINTKSVEPGSFYAMATFELSYN